MLWLTYPWPAWAAANTTLCVSPFCTENRSTKSHVRWVCGPTGKWDCLPYVRDHCRPAIGAKGFDRLINLPFSYLSASAIQMLPDIWSGFCFWCWQRGDRNLRDIQMQLSSAPGDTGQKVGESCFPGTWTMLSPELTFWVLSVKMLVLNTDPVYLWHVSPSQVRLLELYIL